MRSAGRSGASPSLPHALLRQPPERLPTAHSARQIQAFLEPAAAMAWVADRAPPVWRVAHWWWFSTTQALTPAKPEMAFSYQDRSQQISRPPSSADTNWAIHWRPE